MIKVIAIKLVKFFIAKSLKLDYRYLISIICMLLFTCRIFSVAIEEDFRQWKVELSQIVNKAKSASLQQFFSHDAKTMQWWNIGFILCDRSFKNYTSFMPFLAQWLCNSLKHCNAVWPIQWNKKVRFSDCCNAFIDFIVCDICSWSQQHNSIKSKSEAEIWTTTKRVKLQNCRWVKGVHVSADCRAKGSILCRWKKDSTQWINFPADNKNNPVRMVRGEKFKVWKVRAPLYFLEVTWRTKRAPSFYTSRTNSAGGT